MTDQQGRIARGHLENVCVYCGSASGADPAYEAAARTLGRSLAAEGVGLVYGGGGRGLMGTLARTVLEAGGRVTGIIPDFLTAYGSERHERHERIIVPDMSVRKYEMSLRADAFVALPGGIGTLEEVVEQLTLLRLLRHSKPVLLADIGGFWHPLIELFEHMKAHHFINPPLTLDYLRAEAAEDILPSLRRALRDKADSYPPTILTTSSED